MEPEYLDNIQEFEELSQMLEWISSRLSRLKEKYKNEKERN